MTNQRRNLRVESPEGTFQAYLSAPERPGSVAIVVLQEIFGVNANIRATADRFAAAGCAVIAPDLFWRQGDGIQLDPAADRDRAMELMKGLKHGDAVADGAAALAALRREVPGLDRSAAVGYCFGGGVAYLLAVRGCVDAGISYYGTGLPSMLEEMSGLQGRLLLHLAGDDYVCPPDCQEAIAGAAVKAGDSVEVMLHPGVGHAFARIGGEHFDTEAAGRADARTLAVLAELAGKG